VNRGKEYAMLVIHPQFVVNDAQEKKAVLLPFDEWNEVLDALEELDDIAEYDKAKAGDQESVPFEEAVQQLRRGHGS